MSTYIEQTAALIESEVSELPLPTAPDGLYTPIQYIMEDGGKRMRPMLAMLSCAMFCGRPIQAKASAMAIEVFHNFTLLHDDIMDRASVRRGRDTVHVKWGDNTAILSGDAMMIFAYTLLGKSTRFVDIFPIFSQSAIEVCEGQQLDMEFESRLSVSQDDYIEMIRLKTASLMSSALVMGAIEGGANQEEQGALYRFGELLGLAFQIQDDLLDTYGNASTFGKKIGGDIAEGKQTFLKIVATERATEAEREVLRTVRNFETIKAVYDKYGVEKLSQEKIEHYYNEAIDCLLIFDPKQAQHIKEYAQMIFKRTK